MEHGESAVPGEINLGEGVGWRELDMWLPLRLDVGGVFPSITLAYELIVA